MGIDKIGPINNYNRYEKINKKSPIDKSTSSDSVNISKEALNMAETNKIIEILNNTPDVRADKIKMLKEKINDPDYINETVTGAVADKLIDFFKL
ncbi:MAG: flagellar biosynthesis anti-sigma factor FlgM [Spirochaetes bacterium]|nr:flagellar biosynthesis anti-sigma factor FlgM [Spirochaetota bacterium]